MAMRSGRWSKKAWAIGAAVVAAAILAPLAYRQLVRLGILRYNEWDRRDPGRLRVGEPAPDLELLGYDGSRVRLSAFWTDRPLFLVFGSCT